MTSSYSWLNAPCRASTFRDVCLLWSCFRKAPFRNEYAKRGWPNKTCHGIFQNGDLLPSGLYRRPWILTKSVSVPFMGSESRGLRFAASPPVRNFTCPEDLYANNVFALLLL